MTPKRFYITMDQIQAAAVTYTIAVAVLWVLNSLCWPGIKLTPQQQPELLYHNGSSELFLSSAASTKIGI